jgi:lipopolysaccharide export LptBFGC system permease protein LptF
MADILETTMLICFGFSWPMNVYKNYRARTAKSMSLGFILLIICGYLAGISAKIVSGRINYVLAVYVFNLIMVSANLAIYVRNRKYDKNTKA